MVLMRSRSSADEGWLRRSIERDRLRERVTFCKLVSLFPVMISGSCAVMSEFADCCEDTVPMVNDPVTCCVDTGLGICA